jgi:FkbM family methyltransferase
MSWMSDLVRIRGHAVWTPPLGASSLVIDAGSHRGEFSAEIHRRFGCRCIAVEANPTLAAKLQVPPGGQVIHAALAAADGTANFVFRDNPEGGSITAQAADQGNSTSTVEMVALATLMRWIGAQRLDLLKLDIEGAEFPLLEQTPDEVLSRIGQITIEFHDFIPEFKGRGLFEAARARLECLGFLCCPMAFRTHGDVLFLNRQVIRLSAQQRVGIAWLGRWVLKLRDQTGRTR